MCSPIVVRVLRIRVMVGNLLCTVAVRAWASMELVYVVLLQSYSNTIRTLAIHAKTDGRWKLSSFSLRPRAAVRSIPCCTLRKSLRNRRQREVIIAFHPLPVVSIQKALTMHTRVSRHSNVHATSQKVGRTVGVFGMYRYSYPPTEKKIVPVRICQ